MFYSITSAIVIRSLTNRAAYFEGFTESDDYKKEFNLWLLVAICLVATVVVFAFYGVAAVFSRYEQNAMSAQETKTASLIIGVYVRAFPPATLALLILCPQRRLTWCIAFVVAAFTTFLLVGPMAVARFYFACMLIGFIGLLIRRCKVDALWLPVGIFFGLFVLMPILQLGRSTSLEHIDISNAEKDINDIISGPDYDAYSMLINTIKYCEDTNDDLIFFDAPG